MDKDITFPRLVYRGAADTLGTGTIGETKKVEDKAAYEDALKDGWRQHSDDGKPVKADDRGTIKIPAQTVVVDAASANQTVASHEKARDDEAKAADHGLPAPGRNALGGPKK